MLESKEAGDFSAFAFERLKRLSNQMQGQTIQCTCVRHQVGSLPNCRITHKQSMTLTLTLAGIDGVGKKGVGGWCAKTIANHFHSCSQKFTAKWCEHVVQLLFFRPWQLYVVLPDHSFGKLTTTFCRLLYWITFANLCTI